MLLGSRFLEERDQVRSVLGLLEPSEHLSTRGPSKLSTAVLCRSRSAACTAAGGAQRAGGGGGSHHLGARNVRLRVEQVHVQVLVAPCDACRQTPLSKPNSRQDAESRSREPEPERSRRGARSKSTGVREQGNGGRAREAGEQEKRDKRGWGQGKAARSASCTGVGVRGGVGEALGLAGLAAEEAVEVRALLVALGGVGLVALQALGLEDLGPRLGLAWLQVGAVRHLPGHAAAQPQEAPAR